MNKKQNNQIFAAVVQRILGFPFFAALALIGAIAMWFRWIWNFAKYGGEATAYNDKMSRKTVQDVFQKLMEEDK